MNTGLQLTPIESSARRASVLDVALLFAGANIVTTTLVTGGSLGAASSFGRAATIVVIGIALGTLPIAWLARLGPRTGLPSMVLLRQPFGAVGAAGVSVLLVLTNFAWIALNNVIAAGALSRLLGGAEWAWSLGVGAVAIAVAMSGPRSMALFDRVAVPLMATVGVALTLALWRNADTDVLQSVPPSELGVLAGLDIVAGYQVSWSLMFADYTRYQHSETRATQAVFVGLSLSSAWLMLVGAAAGRVGGGNDPTDMILALGLPLAALVIMALSTITTNFVNLYLSSLATKNLWPGAPDRSTVLALGAVGTTFGLLSPRLLDRYAGFMEILGTCLLPIVAVVFVHFFTNQQESIDAEPPRWRPASAFAWLAGVVTYQTIKAIAPEIGATVPTLVVAGGMYWGGRKVLRS